MTPITREPQHEESGRRRDDLRETLRLFDIFRYHAPLRDIVEELNQRLSIYRSELQTRDAVARQPVLEPEAKPNGVSASAPNSAPSLQIGGSTKALEEKMRTALLEVRAILSDDSIKGMEAKAGAVFDWAKKYAALFPELRALRAGQPDTQEQKKEGL